jgi:hypothetical protein
MNKERFDMLEWFSFDGFMLEVVQMVALLVVLVLLGAVMVVLGELVVNLRKRLKAWGNSAPVLKLGQSPAGQAVNQYIAGLAPKVDEADDPLIEDIAKLLQVKRWGFINEATFRQAVSTAATAGVELALDLTDGVPSEDETSGVG